MALDPIVGNRGVELLNWFKGRGLSVAEVGETLAVALIVCVRGVAPDSKAHFLSTLGDMWDDLARTSPRGRGRPQ